MKELINSRLRDLGLRIPDLPAAKGNYVPYVLAGNVAYFSGTLPIEDGALKYTGKVGDTQTIETGYAAAALCVMNALAALKAASDDFARFERIVHLAGYVNGVDGFADSPKVINGASDRLVDLLGDAGRHSRLAVSVNGLPLDATVEIHLIATFSGNLP